MLILGWHFHQPKDLILNGARLQTWGCWLLIWCCTLTYLQRKLLKEEATVVSDMSSLSSRRKLPSHTRFFVMPHGR
ncbi:hypothetical protein ACET3Z_023411 [Daucus carota]